MLYGHTLPNGIALDMNYKPILVRRPDGCESYIQIHDQNGIPIMDSDEKIISQNTYNMALRKYWEINNSLSIIKYAGGMGITYLTNKRLIALRISDATLEALSGLYLTTIPRAIATYLESKSREKKQIRQFYFINLDELVAARPKRFILFALAQNIPYHCQIDNNTFVKVIELMQKNESRRVINGSIFKEEWVYYIPLDKFDDSIYRKRENIMNKALKYEQKCKFQDAVNEYKKALELVPNDNFSQERIQAISRGGTIVAPTAWLCHQNDVSPHLLRDLKQFG